MPESAGLMGTFCPCFLFGHTQARNKGEADPSWCNMDVSCSTTPPLQIHSSSTG